MPKKRGIPKDTKDGRSAAVIWRGFPDFTLQASHPIHIDFLCVVETIVLPLS
jgi:hypothetical protein